MNDSSDLFFLSSGLLPQCDFRWDGDFNAHYALQLSIGSIDLWYGDQHYRLDGAWFWWGYPGPRIRFHPVRGQAGWTHRYATFQGALLTRWITEGLLFEVPQAVSPADTYTTRFDALLALAGRRDRWGQRRAVNALEQILLELAEARTQPVSLPPWLAPLLDELSAGAFAPDYARLAAERGMSLTTLREQFRRATGTTLHSYVLQARLAHARALLTDTDLPLKAIADRLGYGDVFYFSRQFRQSLGVSPSVYRRSRQR
jgi:AraC-like DNA-binding protein